MQFQTTAHGGEQTFPRTPTFIGVLMSRFRKLDFFFNGGGGTIPCRGTHDDRYHCVNLHRNPSALPGSDMRWCIADRWQITWTFIPTLTFSLYCCDLNVPSFHARVYDLRDFISLGWLKFDFRYEVCVI